MIADPSKDEASRGLEKRVEGLASELAELINSSASDDRDGLKDLALSIVRDEVKGRDEGFQPGAAKAGGSGSFNAIGMAMPLGMAGALMIFLFPPVGLLLFGIAGLLVGVGVGASLLSRR